MGETVEREVVKHEYTRASLMRMSREELDEVALGFNINPKRAKNKEVLADTIMLLVAENEVDTDTKLTQKQELFCQLYASDREFFGNGTQAYIEAYDVNVSKPGAYASARAAACKLLTNVNILTRIDSIMEHAVLNDSYVDKKMGFWIMQEANPMASIAAIKEYNKVKKRTTDATLAPGALIQNNYTVNINDERGQYLKDKYTNFMLEVTKTETSAEELSKLRDARDYMPAK